MNVIVASQKASEIITFEKLFDLLDRAIREDSGYSLKDGGVMAVQIPLQRSQPVHHIVKSVAKSAKWSGKFDFERPFYILDEGEYFDILSEISKDFTMWQTTYYHRLCSHQDIVEWYKSTGMKPYLDVLDDQDKNEFISDVYSELIKEYKVQQNGEIIFKFPRLFFIAKK